VEGCSVTVTDTPNDSDTNSSWITADEYQEQVEQAKAMRADARADRDLYDPDRRVTWEGKNYWYTQRDEEWDYSGERG
jgi:hypothetical protein